MTTPTHPYDIATGGNVPIEIRLVDSFGNPSSYCGSLAANGTLLHSLATRSGIPESMGNVQPKMDLPRKAVPGWQAEMVAYFESGLRTITEIR